MKLEFRLDDLVDDRVIGFLSEHLVDMRSDTPPESVHALDVNGLRRPEVRFWSVWNDERLVGCGAIKRIDLTHGEIKSMRVAKESRGEGIGSRILSFLLQEASKSGITRLSLETGSMDFFRPARKLYEKYGFALCEPFGDYEPDPNSVFMTRRVVDREDPSTGMPAEPKSPATLLNS